MVLLLTGSVYREPRENCKVKKKILSCFLLLNGNVNGCTSNNTGNEKQVKGLNF